MIRIPKPALMTIPLLLVLSCNTITSALPGAASASATPNRPAAAPSPLASAALSPTQAPSPTETALPTDTAVPSATEPPTDTPAPAIPTIDPTLRAEMGPIAELQNMHYFLNPVGTPVTTFLGVPIMPQATAGQQFEQTIYSYKAAATLQQARQFYQSRAQALKLFPEPGSGFGGTGAVASHQVNFMGPGLFIYILSYDNDTQNSIVVIDKYG